MGEFDPATGGGISGGRRGKAPLLVFTGGWVPWEPATLEGEILAGYARAMGVSPDSVVTTGRVVNTAEEARAVGALVRERRVTAADSGAAPRMLLVTSAFHMPRARRLFERAGMSVIPSSVDFKVPAGGTVSVLAFLPTAAALQQTEMALREEYGRLFYFVVR